VYVGQSQRICDLHAGHNVLINYREYKYKTVSFIASYIRQINILFIEYDEKIV